MRTKARVGGGEAEVSGDEPKGGQARRAVTWLLVLLLLCGGAGAAGRFFGGGWVWGGFAAALMLTVILVLRAAWQPVGGGNVTVQAAERDTHYIKDTRFTLNAGGISAVAGAALILAVNGAMVTHVSRNVPGGLYYRPTQSPTPTARKSPVASTVAPAGAVAPIFLRDLPPEQIRETSGSLVQEGARITGRQCARSIYQPLAVIGTPLVITITPNTRYKKFMALAGMPDNEDIKASVEFALLGDGQRVIEKRTASPGKPAEFDHDVSAYTTLYLQATLITSKDGTDYAGDYRAVWGDAQFLSTNGQPSICPTSDRN